MAQGSKYPTPDVPTISGVSGNVYQPAEDTFLLLDALESDVDLLRTRVRPHICLEMGYVELCWKHAACKRSAEWTNAVRRLEGSIPCGREDTRHHAIDRAAF